MPASLALRASAALELRRRKAQAGPPPTFGAWLPQASPSWNWTWPHLRYVIDHLEALHRGDINQLMVLMAVRHGKSETVSVRFPVYTLEQNPTERVILGSYSQTYADKLSRKARRLARARGVGLNDERTAVNDWETAAGGGFRAVGVGAGVAGHGGNLIVVDDPIQNREQAESAVYREKVWEWWGSDIWTRREPGCKVILTVAPWHHDGLDGRLLSGERANEWTVIRLPAEAEENDPLGREVGEALCPDRFPIEELQKTREAIGEYAYAGLYQCRPTPRSGNMFPRDKIGEPVPVTSLPEGVIWCRAWDKAGTRDGGKRTAGILMGKSPDGKTFYVGHEVVGQWDAAERERKIKQTAAEDGSGTVIELEQEPGSGGKESAQSTVSMLAGYRVTARPATGDKVTRVEPFAAQWQAGNVRLVEGSWNRAYLDEMEVAPHGKFVDRMDASAMAFHRLTLYHTSTAPFRVQYA